MFRFKKILYRIVIIEHKNIKRIKLKQIKITIKLNCLKMKRIRKTHKGKVKIFK